MYYKNSEEILPVSVIIATYRREESLTKAIKSVVDQTYPYIEIILVDDNADPCWNGAVQGIVNSFAGIRYIRNEENMGSAETRNIGIRAATGFFITFLDDDDVYLPYKVENQVLHMRETQSDYSITDLYLFNERDEIVSKRVRNYILSSHQKDLLTYHLMYHITGTDVMMFRKKYLNLIGGFPQINIGDEFYLMLNAIEYGGSFSYMPGCDVKAYVHENTNGLSTSKEKLQGENELYKVKSRYDMLSRKARRYIRMRHYAVIAFVKYRRKDYFSFIKNGCVAFCSAPIACIHFLFEMR